MFFGGVFPTLAYLGTIHILRNLPTYVIMFLVIKNWHFLTRPPPSTSYYVIYEWSLSKIRPNNLMSIVNAPPAKNSNHKKKDISNNEKNKENRLE